MRLLRALLATGVVGTALISPALAQNQTATVSPITPGTSLPFRVGIDLAGFSLPSGVHSYVMGNMGTKWLILAGRTNGMHSFNNDKNNFPPSQQNTTVFVVDFSQPSVATRSLTDPASGLTQAQIDTLSVTSAQSYQSGSTLYVAGGYGVDTATGKFSTKNVFTAIDVPGLVHWVVSPSPGETAAQHIRQITSSLVQVTGGYMTLSRKSITLLIFGQNFQGFYTPASNGAYTQEVRRFRVNDNGVNLSISALAPINGTGPDPSFRRRDLNVVPVVTTIRGVRIPWVALSGVFTPAGGIWTVPVTIDEHGRASMASPSSLGTFKQGMNNYASATLGIKANAGDMYTVLLGGISFGFFESGTFQTDAEFPFINQVTTVRLDPQGRFSQYLMDAEYPLVLSTQADPAGCLPSPTAPLPGCTPLLFGAGAQFVPAAGLPAYDNGVLKLGLLPAGPTVVGYVVGGIQSALPNTNGPGDSAASPFIFAVTLTRQ